MGGVSVAPRTKPSLLESARNRVKRPSHRGKICYIHGGCVPMDKFDSTYYESAFRFSENCLVLEESSFELLNNYCLRDVISNTFALLQNFAAVIATVIQLRIMLGHEQTFHSRFAYKQVRRKLMRLRRVTLHLTIYGINPISPI